MFSFTPLSFDTPSPMNPIKYRPNLILQETRVIGLHLHRWQYRSIFIQIFTLSSERRTCFETECTMTLQGHPRSLILAPIESAYIWLPTFDLNSNLGPILPRLRRYYSFCTSKAALSIPHPYSCNISRCPRGIDPPCWGCKERTSQASWWWNYFEAFQPVWSQSTN